MILIMMMYNNDNNDNSYDNNNNNNSITYNYQPSSKVIFENLFEILKK